MNIKLIALDLDGTTLNDHGQISQVNQEAIEEVISQGINVVIATGRAFFALPEDIFRIKGMQYVLTSNGAVITDLQAGRPIYENHMDPGAVEEAVALLKQYDFMIEAFIKGNAYIEKTDYDRMEDAGSRFRHVEYVLTTRKPVEGLYDFMLQNKRQIENINVNFEYQRDKADMIPILGDLPNTTLTSSFAHNLEIGSATTSKGTALQEMGFLLGVTAAEMMAIGDSPNDIAMMQLAAMPIAVANAKEEVKAVANYITGTNQRDGVAQAIRKFALNERS